MPLRRTTSPGTVARADAWDYDAALAGRLGNAGLKVDL